MDKIPISIQVPIKDLNYGTLISLWKNRNEQLIDLVTRGVNRTLSMETANAATWTSGWDAIKIVKWLKTDHDLSGPLPTLREANEFRKLIEPDFHSQTTWVYEPF